MDSYHRLEMEGNLGFHWRGGAGAFQSLPSDSFNKRKRSLFGETTKVLFAALKAFIFQSVEECEGKNAIPLMNPKIGEILLSVLLCNFKK